MLEILHPEIAGVANTKPVRYDFRPIRQADCDVEIHDAGISLGAEVVQIASVNSRDWTDIREISPVGVVTETDRAACEVLHDSEAAIGWHDQSLPILAKYPGPKLARR